VTCEWARERIVDELVGLLPGEDRKLLEEHLAACPGCSVLRREHGRLWAELPDAASLPDPSRGLGVLRARVAAEFGGGATAMSERSSAGRWFVNAAAVVALVGAGVLVGSHLQRGSGAPPAAAPGQDGDEATADDTPRFALLIYSPPGESSQPQDVEVEIGEWGRRLFREGIVEDGFGMSEERAWAGSEDPSATGNRRVTHTIRIRAVDLAEARRIAATLPLTARGGLVEVRPID